jgi:hypothetical protein
VEQIKSNNTSTKNGSFINSSQICINLILLIIQIATTFFSIVILVKANTLARVANLYQLNNAIQNRTDALNSFEVKKNEYFISKNIDGIIDSGYIKELNKEERMYIVSLLNIYNIACNQYLKNKIDKDLFKSYYSILIKQIKEEEKYRYYFEERDPNLEFSSINKVYNEWHGNAK